MDMDNHRQNGAKLLSSALMYWMKHKIIVVVNFEHFFKFILCGTKVLNSNRNQQDVLQS